MKKTVFLLKTLLASGALLLSQLGSALACDSTPPTDATTSQCADAGTFTLEASGTDLKWYDDPGVASGTEVHTGVSYDVSDASTTMYVTQTETGCNESPATAITPITKDVPSVSIDVASEACVDEELTVKVTASALGGAITAGDSELTYGTDTIFSASSANSYTITYEVTEDGCTAEASETVVVNAAPAIYGDFQVTEVCKTEDVIDLADNKISYDQSGTTPVFYVDGVETSDLDPASLAGATAELKLVLSKGTCSSEKINTITVNETTAPTADPVTETVGTGNATLTAVSQETSPNLSWFEEGNENPIGSGTELSVPLSGKTAGDYTYYVQETQSNCASERTTVVLTLEDPVCTPPAAPASEATVVACGSANLTATGTNLTWYDGANATDPGTVTDEFDVTVSGTYYVTQTDGCESDSTEITVTINTKPTAPVADATVSACGTTDITATGTDLIWYAGANPADPGTQIDALEVTASGIFYVTQTENGCESDSAQVDVTITSKPAVPSTEATVASCGTTTLTATGTAIKWYDGANATDPGTASDSYEVSTSGTYYVTQTDGCESDSVEVTVTINSTPDAPIASNVDVCEGDPLTLTATGTDLKWYTQQDLLDTPFEGADYSASAEGTFYVTQTENNCESEATAVELAVISADNLELTPASPSTCLNTELTLSASIVDGTWSGVHVTDNGDGTGTFLTDNYNDLTATYSVSKSGCSFDKSVSVVIANAPQAPQLSNYDLENNLCRSTEPIDLASYISYNETPAVVEITGDAIVDGKIDPSAVTYNTLIDFTVAIEDEKGCKSETSGSYQVNLPPAPVATDATIQNTESTQATLQVTGSKTWGFKWILPDGSEGTSTNDNMNIIPSDYNVGTYVFKIVEEINNCAGDTAELVLTVEGDCTPPVAPVADDVEVCPSEALVLEATGADIKWYENSNVSEAPLAETATFEPTDAGTYYVTQTVDDCESIPVEVVAAFITIPTNEISTTADNFCIGEEFTLTVTEAGGTFVNAEVPTLTGTATEYTYQTAIAGDITFEYEVITGECKDTAELVVTINSNDPIDLTWAEAPICSKDTIEITPNIEGGVWSSTGGTIIEGDVATVKFTANEVSTTDIDVTYTTGTPTCGDEETITITVNALPEVAISSADELVCVGITSNIVVSDANGTWNNGAVTSPNTDANFEFTPQTDGVEELIYTVDNGTCTNADTVEVEALSVITINDVSAGSATVCSGEELNITGSFTGTSTDIVWTTEAGEILEGSDDLNKVFTATVDVDTDVEVTLTVGDLDNCGDSESIVISVKALPEVVITEEDADDILCVNETVDLTVNDQTGTWVLGTNGSGDVTYTATTASEKTELVYEVTDANQCKNSDTVAFAILENSDVSFESTLVETCGGKDVQFTATVVNGTTGAWSGDVAVEAEYLVATFNQNPEVDTEYAIYYTDGDLEACGDSAGITIAVKAVPEIEITSADNKTVICEGESIDLTVSIEGGSWNSGDVAPTTDPTVFTYTPSSATGEAVTLTYTVDNGSCEFYNSIEITTIPAVSVNLDKEEETICSGEDLGASVTVAPQSEGQWIVTPGMDNVADMPFTFISPTNVTEETIYSVVYLVGDLDVCGDSDTATITVKPLPVVTAEAEKEEICIDEEVVVTVSPEGGSWNPATMTAGDVATQFTFSNSTAAVYPFTYTVNDGTCENSAELSIEVIAPPVITSFTGDLEICNSETAVDLSAYAQPEGGVFSGTGVSDGVFIPANVTVGETVEITYTLGEVASECYDEEVADFMVIETPAPVVSDVEFELGETNVQITADEYIEGAQIEWSNPEYNISGNGPTAYLYIGQLAEGDYEISVTQTVNECTSEAEVFVMSIIDNSCDVEAPLVEVTEIEICNGAEVPQLSATPKSDTDTVVWFADADLTEELAEGATYTPTLVDGRVQVYAGAKNICVAETAVAIVVEEAAPVEATIEPIPAICYNSDVMVSPVVTPEGGIFILNGDQISVNDLASQVGENTLGYVVGTGECADTAETTLEIIMVEKPEDVTETALLADSPIRLDVNADVRWYDADMTEQLTSDNVYDFEVAETGEYVFKFIAIDATSGCESEPATFTLTVTEEAGVDTSSLYAKISEAKDSLAMMIELQGTEVGQYPETATTDLASAIQTAETAMRDPEATETSISEAQDALQTAIITASESKIKDADELDFENLDALVLTAETTLAEISSEMIGDEPGQYKQTLIDDLSGAVNAAKALKETATSQSEITLAEEAITNASEALVVNPDVNELDFEALDLAVVSAETLLAKATPEMIGTEPGQYKQTIVDALTLAITNAKALKETATEQIQITNAEQALASAVNGFVVNPSVVFLDTDKLEASIESAENLIALATEDMVGEEPNKYHPSVVAGLETALAAAKTALLEADLQAEIDEANGKLEGAIEKFVLTPIADKTVLDAEIVKAKAELEIIKANTGTDEGQFLAEATTSLEAAIAEAEGVVANDNALVSDVNEAISKISHAVVQAKSLVVEPISNDDLEKAIIGAKSALTVVKSNEGNVVDSYPEYIAIQLEEAIAKAEEVLNNTDATQAQIDAATEAIDLAKQEAINGKLEESSFTEQDLTEAIAAAEVLLAEVKDKIGESVGEYPAEVVEKLEATIEEAKAGTSTGTVAEQVAEVISTIEIVEVSVIAPIPPTGINIINKDISVKTGETVTINYNFAPADVNLKDVEWTSSDESVATVVDGVVTPVSSGTVTITITSTEDGSVKAETTVTVLAPVKVSSIDISNDDIELSILGEATISAVVSPANAENRDLSFTVSAGEDVINVSANGTITPITSGMAMITVAATDGSGVFAEVFVTVTTEVSINANAFDYTLSETGSVYTLTVPESVQVSVVSTSGIAVLNTVVDSTIEIDLSDKSGIFYLIAKNEDGIQITEALVAE